MFTLLFSPVLDTSSHAEKMLIGALEGNLATAKTMLAQGTDRNIIAKMTALTLEQIVCIDREFH
ncbi:MAG: hypothetical protein H2069_10490 [Legionella sp.]|nr:hypothetical protein [Legionella sp.]